MKPTIQTVLCPHCMSHQTVDVNSTDDQLCTVCGDKVGMTDDEILQYDVPSGATLDCRICHLARRGNVHGIYTVEWENGDKVQNVAVCDLCVEFAPKDVKLTLQKSLNPNLN